MSKRKIRLKNKRKINHDYIYEKRITGMLLGGEMSRHIENERFSNRMHCYIPLVRNPTQIIGIRAV